MLKRLSIWTISIVIACAAVCGVAFAQDDKLKKEELDQLLAPIALYPDDLLTNVLMASTYPLDIVQAARWRGEPANTKLKGDALTKSLEAKEWDPSVKALVQFPDVLKNMSDKLDWTQKLGDAFLAQQDEVMDQIQFLRAKADEAGHLKSNKQQTVTEEAGSGGQPVYVIEPASSDTVYVPVYQPAVVYGSWSYPDYPPYYWGYPGATYVDGYFWGSAVAIGAGIWGWNHFDWHHHNIDIDVNKWNNINVDRNRITSNKWEHRADHRGPVPYRNKDVREKFKQGDRGPIGDKEFRGRDKADIENRLKATDHARVDDRAGNIRDKGPDRSRDGPASKPANKGKDRAGDRPRPKDVPQKANRDVNRAQPRKAAPAAFDVKKGSDVRRQADRGHASRTAMQAPRGGGRSVGGGGGPRGGGGGRGGGGRRR